MIGLEFRADPKKRVDYSYSTELPSLLSFFRVLLTLAGLAFVVRNFALVLAPTYASGSLLLLMPTGLLSLTLWLFVKGRTCHDGRSRLAQRSHFESFVTTRAVAASLTHRVAQVARDHLDADSRLRKSSAAGRMSGIAN
jgi:hypothetical protein